MVRMLWLAFVALLAYMVGIDAPGEAYHRPLSMFRDGESAWIGYVLFALLLAIGVVAIRTAIRVEAYVNAGIYAVVTGLLAVVAVTPSWDGLHTLCSVAAMLMLYVYYAKVLYDIERYFLFVLQLSMPFLMIMATRLESYGSWQKGMILYFLTATMIHQTLLARWSPQRKPGLLTQLRQALEPPEILTRPRRRRAGRASAGRIKVVMVSYGRDG